MEKYDVIVIGAWSAGLPAAMYSVRYNLKTLVIGELMGWALTQSHSVENYPWFVEISWKELMEKFREQAEKFWAEIIQDKVLKVIKVNDLFEIETYKKKFYSKFVIFAGWNKYKKLWHEKEEGLVWKGISYCATCDWMFFRNQEVSIVWGWNTALTEALYLAEICSKVNIIHRRNEFRAESVLVDKIKANDKIELYLETEVKDFETDKYWFLEKVVLTNWETVNSKWLFIAIGNEPDTSCLEELNIWLDKEGYIIVNEKQETSIENLYAAGDITINSNKFKQTIMSAAEGSLAAHSIQEKSIS